MAQCRECKQTYKHTAGCSKRRSGRVYVGSQDESSSYDGGVSATLFDSSPSYDSGSTSCYDSGSSSSSSDSGSSCGGGGGE